MLGKHHTVSGPAPPCIRSQVDNHHKAPTRRRGIPKVPPQRKSCIDIIDIIDVQFFSKQSINIKNHQICRVQDESTLGIKWYNNVYLSLAHWRLQVSPNQRSTALPTSGGGNIVGNRGGSRSPWVMRRAWRWNSLCSLLCVWYSDHFQIYSKSIQNIFISFKYLYKH